jgi:hypothetical protein
MHSKNFIGSRLNVDRKGRRRNVRLRAQFSISRWQLSSFFSFKTAGTVDLLRADMLQGDPNILHYRDVRIDSMLAQFRDGAFCFCAHLPESVSSQPANEWIGVVERGYQLRDGRGCFAFRFGQFYAGFLAHI